MKVALYAQCPVLLIGDIDRGGVFASLVGHMELFTPEERERIAAFVINKFRGDASLLDSGLEFLQERTGVPTLGVVPMLSDWRGDEEDSLGIEDRRRRAKPDAPLQIAVVRLPFISNYTDFDALADEPDVNVRYVTTPAELEGAAAIVLPGTKSTIADLEWLRASGMAAAVLATAAAGTPVIGVCGGYQMLGRRIHDPEHVESDAGSWTASACSTWRRPSPATSARCASRASCLAPAGPASGLLGPAGTPLHGYEIHMGRTTLGGGAAPLLRLRGADGSAHDDGAGRRAGGRLRGRRRRRLRQLRPRPLRPSGAARRLPRTGCAPARGLPLRESVAAARRRRHRPPRRSRRGASRRRAPGTHRRAGGTMTDDTRDLRLRVRASRHRLPRRRRPRRSRPAHAPRSRRPCTRRRGRLRPPRRQLPARPGAGRRRADLRRQAGGRARRAAGAHQRAACRSTRCRASAWCASRAATRSSSAAAARRPRTCASAACRSSSSPA